MEAKKEVLTSLRHIHELDRVLHVCLTVSREMNGAEAALSNFFMHLVVVQNRAVIKCLPCKDRIINIEVL